MTTRNRTEIVIGPWAKNAGKSQPTTGRVSQGLGRRVQAVEDARPGGGLLARDSRLR